MSRYAASKRLRPLFDSLDRRDVPSSMVTAITADPTPVVSSLPEFGPITNIKIQPPPGGGSSPTQ